jgi:prepilin-type N-terminal cleavage/methylation domain-containing protein
VNRGAWDRTRRPEPADHHRHRAAASGSRAASPRGMTLVEMLVAMTVTLLLMGLIAQLFAIFGEGVRGGRSTIELTDQMRVVAWRLRQDLAGITVTPVPPVRPEADEGYLEIIEGPASDSAPGPCVVPGDSAAFLTADCDDILMFTTRSTAAPFVGRFEGGTIESPVAEVAWFCKRAPDQPPGGPTLYTLYRRQLLVIPYVGAGRFRLNGNALAWDDPVVQESWTNFYSEHDLSCHFDPILRELHPNSLGDLTNRENRFLHNPSGIINRLRFPYPPPSEMPLINPAIPAPLIPPPGYAETLVGSRLGEDVILANVLAFDVRVFDPGAPAQVVSGLAMLPGDPGFDASLAPAASNPRGGYIDLGWNVSAPSSLNWQVPMNATGHGYFSGTGRSVRNPGQPPTFIDLGYRTYDTWSTYYEANGIDEDGDGVVDQGTNGLDDDNNALVDEQGEAETSAPYPVPLRGLEVRIRCYEPSSRQVRQITVRHTFVPH